MKTNTPAPWEIEWYICREGGKELWRVPVCIGPVTIDHNHWAGHHLAVEAKDAQLIAAAPVLLDALQKLLDAMSNYDPDTGKGERRVDGAAAFARAAVAEATGEKP
jgi:hypothetical protein